MGTDEGRDKGLIGRRSMLAGAGAGVVAAVGIASLVAPDAADAAAAGTGSNTPLTMQSNSVDSPDKTANPVTPNIAACATDLDVSPNFGNYLSYGAYVLAVNATASQAGDIDGIRASGRGKGNGVTASGQAGAAVYATSTTGTGVYGATAGKSGFTAVGGLVGESKANYGACGFSSSNAGVRAASTSKEGIRATSSNNVGGSFQGGRAAINLVPRGSAGRPTTGAHSAGDLVVDKSGSLFLCTVTGSPGTWVKVTVTPA